MSAAPEHGGLALRGIEAGYGASTILHGVGLDLPAGSALTVVGPNGAGKSTLMKTVVGLLRPGGGQVWLAGRDVTRLDAPARARAGMGYVPQEANVFRNLSVLENLRLGGEFLLDRRARAGWRERVEEVLTLFPEIRPRLATPAGLLSGGQRQMVAMAAALMPRPALLVLDEPSAGLSPRNAGLLFEAIARIRTGGATLLLIEQNVKLGLSVAERVAVLAAGQVRRVDTPQALLADPDFQRLYMGVAT